MSKFIDALLAASQKKGAPLSETEKANILAQVNKPAPQKGPLGTAIVLALRVHDGQVDKSGQPYILHVLRVGAAGATYEEQVVGFLHDTVEDSRKKKEGFKLGFLDVSNLFGAEIAEAVAAITRKPQGETYPDYIKRVAQNPIARRVKLNDLHDNLGRLHNLPAREAEGLQRRYNAAVARLGNMAA